ncbi:Hypothetical protein CINCED_3A021451, partial [Cinara cedri]
RQKTLTSYTFFRVISEPLRPKDYHELFVATSRLMSFISGLETIVVFETLQSINLSSGYSFGPFALDLHKCILLATINIENNNSLVSLFSHLNNDADQSINKSSNSSLNYFHGIFSMDGWPQS